MSNLYKKAGVDIEKGYESVERIKSHIDKTLNSNVLTQIGGFAGAFSLKDYKMDEPVLVSGTDGVGTKVLLAQQAGIHNTIGIDCVAMCVNDVLAQGAKPLFFLDYLALGQNKPEVVEQIVSGVAQGCQLSDMALIGGETAEMPDLYGEEEYDLAGFTVGIADKEQMFTPDKVKEGDKLIGLPSSGVHSNGFSLVRKLFFKDNDYDFDHKLPSGKTLIETLLEPTRIYVKDVWPLIDQGLISGIAHITGGGFYENIPRMLPDNLAADVQLSSIPEQEIFTTIQELGDVDQEDMYATFNMGVGLALAVSPDKEAEVLEALKDAFVLGHVTEKTDQAVRLN